MNEMSKIIIDFELEALIKEAAEERTEFLLGELKKNMAHVQDVPADFWDNQREVILKTFYSFEKMKAKQNASNW